MTDLTITLPGGLTETVPVPANIPTPVPTALVQEIDAQIVAAEPQALLDLASGAASGNLAAFDADVAKVVSQVSADFASYPATVCFTSGTLIRTARGDVAVEKLVLGDLAVTASGGHEPIRWIGSRTMVPSDSPVPSDVWPVRILAGAFGQDRPARDLFLSPGHPVLVGADANNEGGVLVPIMCLINGTTIARVPVDTVTYWHVELDAHDILLAEGLPAESFLDWGCRPWFVNGADDALADPDLVVSDLDGRCRPVALDGPIVEGERRRIDAVFAMSLAAHCGWSSDLSAAL